MNTAASTLLLFLMIGLFSAAAIVYPTSKANVNGTPPPTAIYIKAALTQNSASQATFSLFVQNIGNTSLTWFNVTLQAASPKIYDYSANPLAPGRNATLALTAEGKYAPGLNYTYAIEFHNNYSQTFTQQSFVQCKSGS